MPDVQNFGDRFLHAVYGNAGQRRKNQLASARFAPDTTPIWKRDQLLDAPKYFVDDSERRFRTVFSDVQTDLLEVGTGFGSPSDLHNGLPLPLQKPPDVRLNVFMGDQFAPVGLHDTATDRGPELCILFNQPQSGTLHEFFGFGTVMIRNLRKPRFLLGSEMYFHLGRPSSLS
jgi:hypothetical protein